MTEQTEQQETEQPRRNPNKELALHDGVGHIVPTNVDEAYHMARLVVDAKLAPNSYNNDPKMITLGIMAALEAGLPPLYGLRQIAIINGRPTIWGDGAMALVQSKNLIAEYRVEEIGTVPVSNDLTKWDDGYGFRVTIMRRGQKGEYVGEFTVGHAKRAKLWMNAKKAPWMEHPTRMLLNRARAFPLRDGFADALGGIAIREEVEDTFEPESKAVEVHLDDASAVEAPPLPEQPE
jgi:hypothetical protein